jgi:hypothetical protein
MTVCAKAESALCSKGWRCSCVHEPEGHIQTCSSLPMYIQLRLWSSVASKTERQGCIIVQSPKRGDKRLAAVIKELMLHLYGMLILTSIL